jgi:uncharacterized protein involved in type VI secretion and phage assembly
MPRARPALPKIGLFGVYCGIDVDVKDPDAQGRVRLTLPWAEGGDGARYETWARLAVPMAGNNRGTWLIPDVDDEVLVAFEAGDPSCPFVIGSLWNGRDAPPALMDGAGRNDHKVIRSRNGITITLYDSNGAERFQVETPGGQTIVLRDGTGQVTIEDSNGNSIELGLDSIKIAASGGVEVIASTVKVAAGKMEIDAGMARFSGVVQCDTLVANSVIASSYSPGAGNVW